MWVCVRRILQGRAQAGAQGIPRLRFKGTVALPAGPRGRAPGGEARQRRRSRRGPGAERADRRDEKPQPRPDTQDLNERSPLVLVFEDNTADGLTMEQPVSNSAGKVIEINNRYINKETNNNTFTF